MHIPFPPQAVFEPRLQRSKRSGINLRSIGSSIGSSNHLGLLPCIASY